MKIVKSKTKKKNSRISASRTISRSYTYDVYSFDELTPEQQEKVIDQFEDDKTTWDCFNDDIMITYQYELEELCNDLTRKTGIEVNSDKLYWQSNSQGPYPEWDLSEVFDTIEKENYTIMFAHASSYDIIPNMYVETLAKEKDIVGDSYYDLFCVKDELQYADLSEKDIVEINDIAEDIQDFLDKVWDLINDVCTAYPDRDWVRGLIESNDYEFCIDADGSVSLY